MKIRFSVLGIFCVAMLLGSNDLVFPMKNSGSDIEGEFMKALLSDSSDEDNENQDTEKNKDQYSDEEVNENQIVQNTQENENPNEKNEEESEYNSTTEDDSEGDNEEEEENIDRKRLNDFIKIESVNLLNKDGNLDDEMEGHLVSQFSKQGSNKQPLIIKIENKKEEVNEENDIKSTIIETIVKDKNLSNEEKNETIKEVQKIEKQEVKLTKDELESVANGLPQNLVQQYIKRVVDGGVIVCGGLILLATIANPANLSCLKLACSQDQVVYAVLSSCVSVGCLISGYKHWASKFLGKAGNWLLSLMPNQKNKKKKVE